MSDLKLFRTQGDALAELDSAAAPPMCGLQTLFERNLDALVAVAEHFLASGCSTAHGGPFIIQTCEGS